MNYTTIDYCNRDVDVSFYIERGDYGDYYQPPSADTVVVKEVFYEGRNITNLVNLEEIESIVSDKHLELCDFDDMSD